MALYDNAHWLLSHIRDSFISSDDTGLCEIVMARDDIARDLEKNGTLYAYPGNDDSDEEDLDALTDSYDIQMDMEFGHRLRTNTAQRLEKMDLERKKDSKIKHIKWEYNPNSLSLKDKEEYFKGKDFRKSNSITHSSPQKQVKSLFSEQLENCPDLPKNPFARYAKFDGNFQIGAPVKRYRIFMCMLPEEQRSYPLQVTVIATAKVIEFIGLICYKYTCEKSSSSHQLLEEDISKYGLYLTEDDGEVDLGFPCLDPSETIGKFEFTSLGLLEMKPSDLARQETVKTIPELKSSSTQNYSNEDQAEDVEEKTAQKLAQDLAKMEVHTNAMEAPRYQLYRVYLIGKVRAKTEVHLGISGEKVEIDPVSMSKGASRFLPRQRSISHHMDNIAGCEFKENKAAGSRAVFTLVYTSHTSIMLDSLNMSLDLSGNSLRRSASFKNHDFEADLSTAEEIIQKINNILELKSGNARKEYIAQRERKASRRKSFHIHR